MAWLIFANIAKFFKYLKNNILTRFDDTLLFIIHIKPKECIFPYQYFLHVNNCSILGDIQEKE